MGIMELVKPGMTQSFSGHNLTERLNDYLPKIFVIGCGGAGNNTINMLMNSGVTGAVTVAINTDKKHLDLINADKKILLGKQITWGLGSGGNPQVGIRCAENSKDILENLIKDADIVFITAGMGGGTGTGTAPYIAELAKKLGITVVAIVSSPFMLEKGRLNYAKEGIEKLRHTSDSVLVLDNNRLLKLCPDLPIKDAFMMMDEFIVSIIKGLTETITVPSLININYSDIRSVLAKGGGIGVLMFGEGSIYAPLEIVTNTLSNPFVAINHKGAKGLVVHITGGSDMSLSLINEVVQGLSKGLDKKADVVFGARFDPQLKGKMKVMAIMTGISQKFVPCPIDQGKREMNGTTKPKPKPIHFNQRGVDLPDGGRSPLGIPWVR